MFGSEIAAAAKEYSHTGKTRILSRLRASRSASRETGGSSGRAVKMCRA